MPHNGYLLFKKKNHSLSALRHTQNQNPQTLNWWLNPKQEFLYERMHRKFTLLTTLGPEISQ